MRVVKCDIVPLYVTLWCTDNGVVVGKKKDEVLSSTEKDRSGHRHGANGLLTVSGKQRSNLHIKHDGSGMLSVRIETTSQLNDRRHFTINVMPDVNQMRSQGKATFKLFSTRYCRPGDTVLLNPGLSTPIEVMTKINGLNKKREQNPLISAQKFMQRAVTELEKDPSGRNKIDTDAVEKLLNMCKHIRSMILKKLPKDLTPKLEKTVSSDVLQELRKPLDPATKDIGMIDLQRSDSNFFEEMVENYATGAAQVVDCLYANDGMYVTLDSQGEGAMARGIRPFSRQNSLIMPDVISQPGLNNAATGIGAGDVFQSPGQGTMGGVAVGNVADALEYGQQQEQQDGDGMRMKMGEDQEQDQSAATSAHHYQILRIPYMSTLADNIATRTGIKKAGSEGNLGEFVQTLQQRESQLADLFKRIDEDGDGKITLEELLKARDEEILQGSDEEIQELHDFMDSQREKDGFIDFDEFVSAVTLLPNSTALKDIARVYGQQTAFGNQPRIGKKRKLVS